MTDECIEWIHECREVFPKFLGRTTGRIIQYRGIDPEALLLSGKRKFEIKIDSLVLSEVKKWNH
ncbi:MAG: hypothetical protein DRO76_05415 [Candidatus Altiarchaeales archaeon]|nr:MAG: hypothetical protein DRO76_05415 [Candidatus Altiarchaeales archaeon]